MHQGRRMAHADKLVQLGAAGRACVMAWAVVSANSRSESAPRSEQRRAGCSRVIGFATAARSPAWRQLSASRSTRTARRWAGSQRAVKAGAARPASAAYELRRSVRRQPLLAACADRSLETCTHERVGRLVQRGPIEAALPDIAGRCAAKRGRFDHRPDVVDERSLTHRRAAQRWPDPGRSARPSMCRPQSTVCASSPCKQRANHVGHVVAGLDIAHRVGEPVGAAAADHIDADHATAVAFDQCTCEGGEVQALTRQAVRADDRVRVISAAPGPVGHAMAGHDCPGTAHGRGSGCQTLVGSKLIIDANNEAQAPRRTIPC